MDIVRSQHDQVEDVDEFRQSMGWKGDVESGVTFKMFCSYLESPRNRVRPSALFSACPGLHVGKKDSRVTPTIPSSLLCLYWP